MTLQYHKQPKLPYERGSGLRYGGIATPYQFARGKAGSWSIRFGVSGFLVAEGAGVSVSVGMKLFRQLEADWQLRKAKRMPKHKVH